MAAPSGQVGEYLQRMPLRPSKAKSCLEQVRVEFLAKLRITARRLTRHLA